MANGNDQKTRLVEYLDLEAKRLQIELRAARLFVGTTDIGNVAEHAIRRFLVDILPNRYKVGVGEVIAPNVQQPEQREQTQQKDVIIFDQYGSAILDWNGSGINLFPVESIYAVLEVKTRISSAEQLLHAIDQVLEVKRLCQTHRREGQKPPFTGVFVFDSQVAGSALFDALKTRHPQGRADFILILQPRDPSDSGNSQYFAHWHYYSRGGGAVWFATADEAERERVNSPENRNKFLTFGDTQRALLWFYLFLLQQIDNMELDRPNLWNYANATQQRLGWRDNE